MILCTTSNFSQEHCRLVREKSGMPVVVTKQLLDLESKDKIKVLLTYGNYGDDITEAMLDLLPNLEWVQLLSAGYDTLPLRVMAERNIGLTTASGVHSKPISEYVLGTMLYFYKNMPIYASNKRSRIWDGSDYSEEIEGKTIGILGTGHIGKEIAGKCKLMGMTTLGINSDGRPIDHFDGVLPMTRLDELLAASDVICSVLPSTPHTVGLMNKDRFQEMKDGCVFINVGRGDLVQEEDLIDCLRQGKFKGVALDVFRQEPLPENHPFWEIEQILITPHISAKTDRYMDRCTELFLGNFEHYRTRQFERMTNFIDLKKLK